MTSSASQAQHGRLLGDLGAEEARFAWQEHAGAALQHWQAFPLSSFPTPLAAIRRYLEGEALPLPEAVCLAVTSALEGDEICHGPWHFSLRALGHALGTEKVWAISSFAALASAVPTLTGKARLQTGGGQPDLTRPVALLGVGHRLGLASLIPAGGGRWLIVPGEGDALSLTANDEREWFVAEHVRLAHGHASCGAVLNGPGLVLLAQWIAQIEGQGVNVRKPGDVFARATSGQDPICAEALALFTRWLGRLAADLCLSVGALGGLYIGGGVIPRMGWQFDWGLFREAFESRGQRSDYLRAIPSYLIMVEQPALIGAAASLDELIRSEI